MKNHKGTIEGPDEYRAAEEAELAVSLEIGIVNDVADLLHKQPGTDTKQWCLGKKYESVIPQLDALLAGAGVDVEIGLPPGEQEKKNR